MQRFLKNAKKGESKTILTPDYNNKTCLKSTGFV